MTQQFKKGQKVRATAKAADLGWIREGDVGVYVGRGVHHVVDFPQWKRVYLEDDDIEPYVETPSFKKGDKVTVREGATSIRGHKRDPKEVRTVRAVWPDGRVGLHSTGGGTPGNVFEPVDLVPYVESPALDPSKVKAGDTVTVHVVTIDSPAYDVSGETYMLGHALAVGGHVLTGPGVTLTAHQPAPEPEPELPEGTIALIYGQKHVLIKRGRTLIAHADRHSGDPMVEGIGKDAGLNNKMLWVNIERGWAFNEYRSPLQTEASTPQVVYNPDASVVVDPATVDVKAVGATLHEAYSWGVSPSWDEVARTVLAEVGIEVPR